MARLKYIKHLTSKNTQLPHLTPLCSKPYTARAPYSYASSHTVVIKRGIMRLSWAIILLCSAAPTHSTSPVQYQAIKQQAYKSDLLHSDQEQQALIHEVSILIKTHHIVMTRLMDMMNMINSLITYWEAQYNRRFMFFVEQGPRFWFSQETVEQRCTTTITALQRIAEEHAAVIGSTHDTIALLDKEQNAQLLRSALRQAHQKLFTILQPTTTPQPLCIERALQNYERALHVQVNTYKKTPVLHRAWLPVAGLTVAAATVHALYKKMGSLVTQWWSDEGKTGFSALYNHHVHNPSVSIYNALFKKQYNTFESRHQLERDKAFYEECLNHVLSSKQLPNIDAMSFDEKDTLFLQSYRDVTNHAVYKTVFQSETIPFLRTYIARIALPASEMILKSQEVVNELHVTNQLVIAIPALMCAYIAYKTIASVIYASGKKVFYRIDKTQIQEAMRKLDRLINRNERKDSLSAADCGFLLYWVSRLRRHITALEHSEKTMFAHDLDDLECDEFSIQQKRTVIERIYRTYTVLKNEGA